MKILTITPGTEAFEEALRGYVRCERINDVVARPNSKRYTEYLHLIQSQFMRDPVVDPNDQYRDRELVPRAIEAYELKHGVELRTDRIYFAEDFPICCAPDAVESDLIAITVHCRTSLDTYYAAIERGLDNHMRRVSQVQMILTGCRFALHLNYFEDQETRTRKLHEIEVMYDRRRAEQLLDSMREFSLKSRFKAAENAA